LHLRQLQRIQRRSVRRTRSCVQRTTWNTRCRPWSSNNWRASHDSVLSVRSRCKLLNATYWALGLSCTNTGSTATHAAVEVMTAD